MTRRKHVHATRMEKQRHSCGGYSTCLRIHGRLNGSLMIQLDHRCFSEFAILSSWWQTFATPCILPLVDGCKRATRELALRSGWCACRDARPSSTRIDVVLEDRLKSRREVFLDTMLITSIIEVTEILTVRTVYKLQASRSVDLVWTSFERNFHSRTMPLYLR